MTTESPIISLSNVSKEFKKKHKIIHALSNINLSISRGDVVAIVGHSGSGKSTLLQIMGGLDKPSSGRVVVNGELINKMSDRKLANFRTRTIGFVFQEYYLQPFLTLKKNIELAGVASRTNRQRRNQLSSALAESFGLTDRLLHKPDELSGGQSQRAAIARAIFNNPPIILADEPTGNLDPQSSQQVMDLLLSLNRHFNTTIVIVTHNPEIAQRANRIIRIESGQIVNN